MHDKPQLFIFGLGYSAQAVARAAMRAGFSVSGTTRNPQKVAALEAAGIRTYLMDASPQWNSQIEAALGEATHLLSSVPPQEGGDVVLPLITGYKPLATDHWLGYFSTTGVYGDYQGAWVDETSELRPNNARLRRRVEAEAVWQALGGNVFRLAGIYGVGRSVVEDVLEGSARRVDKPGQVFSRIHVEDIAQAVLASMAKPNPGAVYNLCDNEPAAAHEVVAFACELLGKPLPPLIPFEQADFSPMGREFYSANRRVSNRRLVEELQITLQYPSYRDGVRAIANQLKVV